MLLIRELLANGPSRYSDLRDGLPGVATNLLAERLRDLEAHGVIRSYEAPPPVATRLFELTERGTALEPVLDALARWGGPLMAQQRADDAFRSHWLLLPARLRLGDNTPTEPAACLEVRTGERPLTVTVAAGRVAAEMGAHPDPDAVVAGPPDVVLALLLGRLDLNVAEQRGVTYQGPEALLARLRPPSGALADPARAPLPTPERT